MVDTVPYKMVRSQPVAGAKLCHVICSYVIISQVTTNQTRCQNLEGLALRITYPGYPQMYCQVICCNQPITWL